MIKINNVTKIFDKTKSLDGVSLEFNKNDCVALMGPNGAGKTTLIRLILGYYHGNSGDISINGLNPIKDRVKVLENVAFVPQLPPPIKLTLGELIQYVCKSSNIEKDKILNLAKEMELEIEPILNKSFFKLSGGMKQKLLIAIALAKNSSIMIFDEPTANLDPKARDNFYKLLKTLCNDKIIIFVTHRFDEVKEITNREIYFDLGKVISDERV